MSKLIFRRPDNPTRDFEPFLHKLDNGFERGNWIAQPKGDGWRRPGYKENGDWSFYAKATMGEEARQMPPAKLVNALVECGLPDGTALDMEWMGTRCTQYTGGQHWFVVYDLLYQGFEWQGGVALEERLEKLVKLFRRRKIPQTIILCPGTTEDFVEYFNVQKENNLSEGIVCKRLNSKLLGRLPGTTSDCHNFDWRKVKYRDILS